MLPMKAIGLDEFRFRLAADTILRVVSYHEPIAGGFRSGSV